MTVLVKPLWCPVSIADVGSARTAPVRAHLSGLASRERHDLSPDLLQKHYWQRNLLNQGDNLTERAAFESAEAAKESVPC